MTRMRTVPSFSRVTGCFNPRTQEEEVKKNREDVEQTARTLRTVCILALIVPSMLSGQLHASFVKGTDQQIKKSDVFCWNHTVYMLIYKRVLSVLYMLLRFRISN